MIKKNTRNLIDNALVKNPRYVKIRSIIPNSITMLCLWSGLAAIKYASEGEIEYALFAILFGAACDGFDGRVARKMKVASEFGGILDSLADFITFGVAPAMVLFFWNESSYPYLWPSCLFYATCSALRLARFNVSLNDEGNDERYKNYFVGIPAPMAALVVLAPISSYLFWTTTLAEYTVGIELLTYHYIAVIPSLIIIGILMVSKIPTFSIKNIAYFGRHSFAVFVISAGLLFGIIENIWLTWTSFFIFYAISMVITIIVFYMNHTRIKIKKI